MKTYGFMWAKCQRKPTELCSQYFCVSIVCLFQHKNRCLTIGTPSNKPIEHQRIHKPTVRHPIDRKQNKQQKTKVKTKKSNSTIGN